MQIQCPRCRSMYATMPGASPRCPRCGDSADAVTLPDLPATSLAKAGPPAADTDIGKVIGGYRILARLGRGGMSAVYKAEQISLGRIVALKIPYEEFARDRRQRARFEREAQTLARLDHPNIVQIYDVGSDQGRYYIAMEYVEGTTLGRFLARRGPLPASRGVPIFKKCCAALACAHGEKIVHRDIKPDNILLTADGQPKISDFGLAKSLEKASNLSITGTILGTPLYMSPEQADGRELDTRSDLYSLGATFYHAFCGHPPFEGATPVTIVLKHVREILRPANEVNAAVPTGLAAILSRMLAKRPEDRYPTAEAILAAVEALEKRETPSPSVPAPPPPSRLNLRNKRLAGAAIAAGILFVIAAAWGFARSGSGSTKPDLFPKVATSPETVRGPRLKTPPAREVEPTIKQPDATSTADTAAAKREPGENSAMSLDSAMVEETDDAYDLLAPPKAPPDSDIQHKDTAGDQLAYAESRKDRHERIEAFRAVIRNFPKEPEFGTRAALTMAREALTQGEPMVAFATLRSSRHLFATYLESHQNVKEEYDRLTHEVYAKLPPGMRRQIEETRGRNGRRPVF